MSQTEKSTRMGEAVFDVIGLQKTVAHLAEKLERVRRAYILVSSQMPGLAVVLANPKRVTFTDPTPEERLAPEYLMSQAQLADLLSDYRFANAALRAARARLAASRV